MILNVHPRPPQVQRQINEATQRIVAANAAGMPRFPPMPPGFGHPFFPVPPPQMPFSAQAPPFVPAPPVQSQQQVQPFPKEPTEDNVCKFATECKNPYCKFSHPSPVATKESGIVVSSEKCEKQLNCDNKVRTHLLP
jgi:hypothetical protein